MHRSAYRLAAQLLEADEEDYAREEEGEKFDKSHYIRGHDSFDVVYEDDTLQLVRPLDFWTWQRYSQKAEVSEYEKWKSYNWKKSPAYFFVLPKDQKLVLYLPLSVKGEAAAAESRINLAIPKYSLSIKAGLTAFYTQQLKGRKTDFWDDYFWAALRYGGYDAVKPFLRRADLSMSKVWRIGAGILRAGQIKQGTELMRQFGISFERVSLQQDGFLLHYDDWDDLAVYFDRRYRDGARKVFSGDDSHYYEPNVSWKDIIDHVNKANWTSILDLMVGAKVDPVNLQGYEFDPEELDSDGLYTLTLTFLQELSETDRYQLLSDEDQFEFICQAIAWSGNVAYEDAARSALVQGYESEIKSALGCKEVEWIKGAGEKYTLAFKIPYSQLIETLENYEKINSDYYEDDDWHGLFENGTDEITPADDYSHYEQFDGEYFNDSLTSRLGDEVPSYQDKSDPNQPELPLPPTT